jgi:hypothetical protein
MRRRSLLALATLVAAVIALDVAIAKAPRVEMAPLPPQQLLANKARGSCSIESVDGVKFTDVPTLAVESRTVKVTGWYMSELSKVPDTRANLRLVAEGTDTGWVGPITHWTPRPDVIEGMQALGAGDPGFAQRIDLSGLAPGNYRLAVVWTEAGQSYACDPGRTLVVDG